MMREPPTMKIMADFLPQIISENPRGCMDLRVGGFIYVNSLTRWTCVLHRICVDVAWKHQCGFEVKQSWVFIPLHKLNKLLNFLHDKIVIIESVCLLSFLSRLDNSGNMPSIVPGMCTKCVKLPSLLSPESRHSFLPEAILVIQG